MILSPLDAAFGWRKCFYYRVIGIVVSQFTLYNNAEKQEKRLIIAGASKEETKHHGIAGRNPFLLLIFLPTSLKGMLFWELRYGYLWFVNSLGYTGFGKHWSVLCLI
ncbi:hypothetical protein KCP69_26450 [Salmonella enterica subsp. enterica]|nr:hypothetical protein KCP69_26450 [Salmonella enterica subsp. enterica]